MPMRIVIALLPLLLLPQRSWAQSDLKQAAKIVEFIQLGGVLRGLLFIAVAALLLWFLRRIGDRLGERFTERRLLLQQVSTILRFSIYLITFIVVLRSMFKLEKEMVLALTGTAAVSVGFALKDLAASVLAGMIILFDRPFQVGDRVTFAGQYGEITTIGLRSVRMVTLDDSLVTIPNNKFLTDLVVSGNAGALHMQIVIDFYVAQDADVASARRIVSEAVRTSRFVYLELPVTVLVNDLMHENYLCTRLRAKAYVLDVRYEKAFESDVTLSVKQAFAASGIAPPAVRTSGCACAAAASTGEPESRRPRA